jgi:TolB-like protein
MSLFEELKRRNVFRVGAAYVVVGWLIIQVVETIFPIYGIAESWIRLVITVLAIGLIPLLIFAWAFELTPEGLKKESDVDRTQSIAPHTGKKLDRTIMVVLALALVYFAVDKFVLNPQREAAVQEQVAVQVEEAIQQGRTEALVESYGDKSIAVLAFQDMSQDKDQEYLSDGIAEELLNLLAKIPDLRVISRSSAFSFKGQNLELTEIAERLNVAHILEGSVRKAGNKVRITAQLIEARSDTHLWSETYDRELDDIFAIQDEISATVVAQLKITLLGEAPKTVEINSEAYALFLQARHLGQQFTVDTIGASS